MSIVYDPSKILGRSVSEAKIKRMINKRNLTIKSAALTFVDSLDVLDKAKIVAVATKVLDNYRKRIRTEGESKTDLLKDPKQLIQRVQNEVVFEIKEEIKGKYAGEKYRWLPSDAEEPDPEHQLNYGMVFIVGEGEMPGDRIGCRCGMELLVDEEELNL